MFDLSCVVHLQQIVAAELNVVHCDTVLEEVDRELRGPIRVRFCYHLYEEISNCYR